MSVKSTYGAGDGFVHGTKMADRTGKRTILTIPRKKGDSEQSRISACEFLFYYPARLQRP